MTDCRSAARWTWLIALLAAAATPAWALGQEAEVDKAEQSERMAELEKTLSGATMVGHFTVTGEAGNKPAEERYELGQVKHLGSGQWLIQARIKYGEHDVTVPLTLPIRWAGDTPMICVDDVPIPGLGTFTARVMIFRDHYAGFWTGEDHGGHLYGMIERAKVADDETR